MLLTLALLAVPQQDFVNFETPHVAPLALTPDESRLLAVNTADGVLEVLDATGASPTPLFAVPVGVDPVAVRARTDDEAWVVNHVSDSISIVDLTTGHVRATLDTHDEPCDVVFAGLPERAFVSCSQANTVLVFDPATSTAPPLRRRDRTARSRARSPSAPTARRSTSRSSSPATAPRSSAAACDASNTLSAQRRAPTRSDRTAARTRRRTTATSFEPAIAVGLPTAAPRRA